MLLVGTFCPMVKPRAPYFVLLDILYCETRFVSPVNCRKQFLFILTKQEL